MIGRTNPTLSPDKPPRLALPDDSEDRGLRLQQLTERDGSVRGFDDPHSRDDHSKPPAARGKVRLDLRPEASHPHRRDSEQMTREVFDELEEAKREIEAAVRCEFDQQLQQLQTDFEAQVSSLDLQRVQLEKKVASLRNIQVMMEDEFERKEAGYLETIARLNAALDAKTSADLDRSHRTFQADSKREQPSHRSRLSRVDEGKEAAEQAKQKSLSRQLFDRVAQQQQPGRSNSRSFSQEKAENSRCLNQQSIRDLEEEQAGQAEPLASFARLDLQPSALDFDPFEIKQSSQLADLARQILEQRRTSLSQLKQQDSSHLFVEASPLLQPSPKRHPQSVKELRAKQSQTQQPAPDTPEPTSPKKRRFFEADEKHRHETEPPKQSSGRAPSQQSARHGRSSSILPVGHILELALQPDSRDDQKSLKMKQLKKQLAASSISDEVLTPKVHAKLMAISYQKKSAEPSPKQAAQHEYLAKLLSMLEHLFREQFFSVQRRLEVLGELEAAGSLEARTARARSWVDALQQAQARHGPLLELMRRREAVRVHIEQLALGFTDLRQLPDFNRETSSLYSLLRTVNRQAFSHLHRHPSSPRAQLPDYFGVALLDLIASDFWEEDYLRRLEGRRQAGRL